MILAIICVARGGKGAMPSKFLENIVILCLEKHFFKQNNAIRRKSNILAPPIILRPPQIFGLATPLLALGQLCFSGKRMQIDQKFWM